jgi:molybdopterin synthase catalytic subunit
MRVNIKLFAVLRERAGTPQVMLHLRPGATVADASEQLAVKFPEIKPLLARVAFAVNQNYAKSDARLTDGDELALIPPVSGGCGGVLP